MKAIIIALLTIIVLSQCRHSAIIVKDSSCCGSPCCGGYAPLNPSWIKPEYKSDTLSKQESEFLFCDPIVSKLPGTGVIVDSAFMIFFKVGEPKFPNAGDSIYINAALAHFNKSVVEREGMLLGIDTIDGYEYDTSAGKIIFHPALFNNERILIYASISPPLKTRLFNEPVGIGIHGNAILHKELDSMLKCKIP